MPEDGYDSWKRCSIFELDKTTSNYSDKKQQLSRERARQKKQTASSEVKKKTATKAGVPKKNIRCNVIKRVPSENAISRNLLEDPVNKNSTPKIATANNASTSSVKKYINSKECGKYSLEISMKGILSKKLDYRCVRIHLNSGRNITPSIGFDEEKKKAYISGAVYIEEALNAIKSLFK